LAQSTTPRPDHAITAWLAAGTKLRHISGLIVFRRSAMSINPTDLRQPGAPHVDSYWAATAGAEVENCEPVSGDMDVDVAIIGGGYTGLSAAYHLGREHGISAHVLEANRIGWGCSGRNGGFCSTGIGKEDFDDWTARWGLTAAKAIFEQSREAVRTVKHLVETESIDVDKTPEGGLELAHRPNRMAELAARQKHLQDMFGMDVKLLSKAELEGGYLVSREAHGALIHGEGFGLHAMKLSRGLARAAQRHGAVLHGASPVTSWRRDGDRHLLTTPRGTLRARHVVIACNGYTGDRLHPATSGRLLPVLSNIIVTRALTPTERQSVNWHTYLKIWDTRYLLFYYRLLPQNRVMFGARGGIEDKPGSNRHERIWLERRFAEMFPPLAKVESEYFWRGWVCLSRDRNPHVGTVEDGTVHYALAYMGSGVALAVYCGRMLAARIAGKPGGEAGPLLGNPLPRFPFPALRRIYQRMAYSYYGFKDEWL
jgi:gamma-glutamylputrescine oxidase